MTKSILALGSLQCSFRSQAQMKLPVPWLDNDRTALPQGNAPLREKKKLSNPRPLPVPPPLPPDFTLTVALNFRKFSQCFLPCSNKGELGSGFKVIILTCTGEQTSMRYLPKHWLPTQTGSNRPLRITLQFSRTIT